MSLEEKFKAAVEVVKSLPIDGAFQPSPELVLRFYAYYKQATEGPCTASKPRLWDLTNKAKWEQWKKLENMPKEDAMTKYIDELKMIIETMSYSSSVEKFMNLLGPFYEPVLEEELNGQANGNNTDEVHITNSAMSNMEFATTAKEEMSDKSIEDNSVVPNNHEEFANSIPNSSFESGVDDVPTSDEEFSDLFYSTEENTSEKMAPDGKLHSMLNKPVVNGDEGSSVFCECSETVCDCHTGRDNNRWHLFNTTSSAEDLTNINHLERNSRMTLCCKKDSSVQTRSCGDQNCTLQDDSSSTDSSFCSPVRPKNNDLDMLNIKALSYARSCAAGNGGGCESERLVQKNRSSLNDPVSSSLFSLQCAMNEAVMRLRSLESLLQHTLKKQKPSKGYKVPILDISPLGAAFFFIWPFVVHWIMYSFYRRKKK